MATLISAIYGSTTFDVGIPEPTDGANIQRALADYHYGPGNVAGSSTTTGLNYHLNQLNNLKAPLASPTFTGTATFSGPLVSSASVNLSGTKTISGTTTISGATTHSGNLEVTGRLDAYEIRESVADITIVSSTATIDYAVGTIGFIASAPGANFTINVTNVPTDNGKAISVVLMVTQGATGRIPSAFQIDGSAQTIRWVSGTAPTPTASKIDIFNFTLIRRSGAWTVLGNSSLNY